MTGARRNHIEKFFSLAEEKEDNKTHLPDYIMEKIPGSLVLKRIIEECELEIEITGYAYMIISAYAWGNHLFMKYMLYELLTKAIANHQKRIDVSYIKSIYQEEDFFTIHLDFMTWNLEHENELKHPDFWTKRFKTSCPAPHSKLFRSKKK